MNVAKLLIVILGATGETAWGGGKRGKVKVNQRGEDEGGNGGRMERE